MSSPKLVRLPESGAVIDLNRIAFIARANGEVNTYGVVLVGTNVTPAFSGTDIDALDKYIEDLPRKPVVD